MSSDSSFKLLLIYVRDITVKSAKKVLKIVELTGNKSESTNNNNVAVEIKCSELEKELITTDRRELQELLKRNGRTE